MSFSDLEGKLPRHTSEFNRYCRNVANTGLVAALPLSVAARPKQQP